MTIDDTGQLSHWRGLRTLTDAILHEETAILLYHSLSGVLEANDEYMFLSNGRHVHNSGVENYISAHLARTLVLRKVKIGKRRIEYAALELMMKELEPIIERNDGGKATRKRVDIALLDEKDQVIAVIELKRHLHDSKSSDIDRVLDIISTCKETDGGSLKAGLIIGFDTLYDSTKKSREDRIRDFLRPFERKLKSYECEIGWMERQNLFAETHQQSLKSFIAIGICFRLKKK